MRPSTAFRKSCKQMWSHDDRGRWIVAWHRFDNRLSGERFSSLSRARRFANRVNGRVLHYHSRDWRQLTEREQAELSARRWRSISLATRGAEDVSLLSLIDVVRAAVSEHL